MSGKYDMVILDEINVALDFKLVDLKDVMKLIKNKPAHVDLILTGRYARRKSSSSPIPSATFRKSSITTMPYQRPRGNRILNTSSLKLTEDKYVCMANQSEAWIALATLTALEIVLASTISSLFLFWSAGCRKTNRILQETQADAGHVDTTGASVFHLLGYQTDRALFTVFGQEISGRDMILIGGGLFLLAKATHEIHTSLEGAQEETPRLISSSVAAVLIQIALLDIVFSLDSVITAVGLAKDVSIMAIAIICAVGVMLFAAKPISKFVDAHPTIKILALSFLLLIGVTLVAEGFDVHVPKGYIYFAMAFSVAWKCSICACAISK